MKSFSLVGKALSKAESSTRHFGSVNTGFLSTSPSKVFFSQHKSHCTRARKTLDVQANGLNKWADQGMDDGDALEDPFDRDVGAVVLKVLTAKAVQRLLTMLGEYDLLQQNWFHQYCAEHPPTTGNKFIDELMQAKGEVIHDTTTQTDHAVDPQNLAHRILQMRADMADRLVTGMIKYTEVENMTVLKKHLERATYMSGSHEGGGEQGKSRRGYYQSRRSGI